jgi:dynein heavy chain
MFEVLMTTSDIVEEWKKFQRTWLYLDKIFESKETRESISEWRSFDAVHRQYGHLMNKVYKNKNVFVSCFNLELKDLKKMRDPQRMRDFRKWNEAMDKVLAALNKYLEEKRKFFPRFYFISDDELLTLLSEQSSVVEMEKYLGNVFEGIHKLVVQDETTIERIKSVQGEEVRLLQSFKMTEKDSLKFWEKLEETMRKTLRRQVNIANADHHAKIDQPGGMEEWSLEYCGQVTATVLLINWTEQTEDAFAEMEAEDGDPSAMGRHL